MALDIPQNQLIQMVGHDGSEIIWPDQPEPYNRRSFHPQELIDCAVKLDHIVMCIERQPISVISQSDTPYTLPLNAKRFDYYIHTFNNGVLVGLTPKGKPHAVAWDGMQIIDPIGQKYAIVHFDPKLYYIILDK